MRVQLLRRCFSTTSSAVHMAEEKLRLPPLPSISDIIRLYRINALKKLSQNFLLEPRLHDKIVKAAKGVKDCHVCEIGPGPGGITRAILEHGAAKLMVVEKDSRFMPSLELLAEASEGRMSIFLGDIMHFDLKKIFPKELARDWNDKPPPIHIIGNLPFNVSTFLIIKFLRDISNRAGLWEFGRVRLTLTFQKEVAERMIAPLSSPQRCRLSLMCQHLCDVDHKFTISGKAFLPKPDVDVGVVHFVPLIEPKIKLPIEVVEKFLRHIFHCRQKYCKFGVATLFPKTKEVELTDELFEIAVVDPTTRSFRLSMEEIERMCRAYHQICKRNPLLFDYNYRDKKSVDFYLYESDVQESIKH